MLLPALQLHSSAGDIVKMGAYGLSADLLVIFAVLSPIALVASIMIAWKIRPEKKSVILVSLWSNIAVAVTFLLLRSA